MVDSEVLPVVCKALVAAPDGKGSATAETGIVLWSDAIATGIEADIVV